MRENGGGDVYKRQTLEGAHVHAVAELLPYSGGLKRNIVQCLDDYGIPLKLRHTVTEIKGKERLESVVLSEVDAVSYTHLDVYKRQVSCNGIFCT